MIWNKTTVPIAVEERHDLSMSLGKAFAQAYKIHPLAEDTQQILELYKQSRRMVKRPSAGEKRYGSTDAWYSTQ